MNKRIQHINNQNIAWPIISYILGLLDPTAGRQRVVARLMKGTPLHNIVIIMVIYSIVYVDNEWE